MGIVKFFNGSYTPSNEDAKKLQDLQDHIASCRAEINNMANKTKDPAFFRVKKMRDMNKALRNTIQVVEEVDDTENQNIEYNSSQGVT